ncbi:MAG TPA: Lrp/AsnC family transcriptional regulator [Polyangiaceae bacterium]|nr:Lrp/AsnC family transcriptional regulator [Polyangiaceae bacterium]
MNHDLDTTDRHILRLLQKDARISNHDLAAAVGLSDTPCARRVKRLEEEGYIVGQVALLDPDKLGLKLTALVSVSMDRHTPERFESFEKSVARMPEVLECSLVTGQSADFVLKVVVSDMHHYERFLLGQLTKTPGVSGVHSSFVLRRIRSTTALPVDGEDRPEPRRGAKKR